MISLLVSDFRKISVSVPSIPVAVLVVPNVHTLAGHAVVAIHLAPTATWF